MSANTIITSTVTGGTNSHATVAEEANVIATDFVTQGVVGAITLNTGSGGTGSFCVNQNTGSNLAINILAGQAYITATPSSQDSQVLRARASSDYTAYTISSNSSGSTKYDWIYLQVDATKANNPASDASDVTSIYTSRSSSNTTDNGTPPTYGLLLAIVTVANGATAVANSNITDKRFNTSIGAQNGSLIVTQSATGQPALIQAAGIDANINVQAKGKGTGAFDPAIPYKFSVYRNATWSTPNNTAALLTFDTKTFDTSSNYSTSTGKFTATISGFYWFIAEANFSGSSTNNYVTLYKNGSEMLRGSQISSSATVSAGVSGMLQLSASDYVQVYTFDVVTHTGLGGANQTYFHGYLLSIT